MPQTPLPRFVRINYAIRTGAFAFSFVVIGLHGWEKAYGTLFWALLAAQFLAYPHLLYLRARWSREPVQAEVQGMLLDAACFGAWIGALHFPLWIAYGALFSTALNMASVRGVQGALASMAATGSGAAIAVAAGDFRFEPATSAGVTALCFFGSLAYCAAIGNVMHRQSRRVAAARDDKLRSEARYRLLAENAADLIGLIDADGRWLYASPSYERVLQERDLEPGADAFRRVHPDDADAARIAVRRAAASRKGLELVMRLVDREGRLRQLRTRVQPVNGENAPVTQLVLVSQDVTDLLESEERMLLAAHALEGMAEGIVITAADGTILNVNRAFSEITGYGRDEALGAKEKEFRNALQPPEFYDDLYAVVHREGYWSGTTWTRRRNGSVYREWRSVRAIRNADGAITHYVIVFCEVGAAGARAEDAVRA
jgi:PAS domain S-box-containing protein